MKKFTAIKKNITKIAVLLTVLCIALTCLTGIGLNRAFAEEDKNDYEFTDFANTELKVSNNQFDEGGDSFPSNPDSWTGAYVGNYSNTNLVSGVIELTGETYLDEDNYEAAKLYKYEEYENKEIPKTPFGINTSIPNGDLYYPGTNKKVLMINTNGTTVSYGYSSNTLALEANSFYKISAFVKTGDFNQSHGAVIKLTGFKDGEDVGFWNINTLTGLKDGNGQYELNKENMFGWKEYTVYVATGFNTESVTLNLQVGDFTEDNVTPSKGYAFFDNVNAYQISATAFYTETADFSDMLKDRYVVKDMNVYDYLTDGSTVIGDFSNGLSGWTDITEDEEGNHYGGAMKYIYDAASSLSPENALGLNADPVSPKGKTADNGVSTNNILILRSSSPVQAGVRSQNILIQRNKYYRIGVWAKAQELGVSSTASIVISGQSTIASNDYKLEPVAVDAIEVDGGIESRYGWKEFSFYVNGSSLKDVNINIELWLGYANLSSGLVMFDEITVKELSYTEYKDNSSGGLTVSVDSAPENTGINNGTFTVAGDNDEYKYPLKPADWTMYDASSIGTAGFSSSPVNTDRIATGIIATDEDHFNANRSNYLGAANPVNAGDDDINNVLLLASENETAICFASSDITVTANTYYRLDVTLQVRDITGYGANIVLKSGNGVIATIEGITSTNYSFKTYTIFVQGGYVDNTVTVEIWLGLNDKVNNQSKRSSGYVYVSKAALTTVSDEAEFTTAVNSVKADYEAGQLTDRSYFSFADSVMDVFDYYSKDQIKDAYKWTLQKADPNSIVKAGIFDAMNMPADQNEIPSYFTRAFNSLGSENRNVLYLRNVSDTYSALVLSKNVTFTATKYYVVSFDVMVDIPQEYLDKENSVAAVISLGGIDRKIEIRNTYDTAGIETQNGISYYRMFKSYKFYVAAGDSDLSTSITISLGGELPNQFITGQVYIANADIQEISNVAFEEETAGVAEDDEFIRFANFAEAGSSDTTPDDEEPEEPEESENGNVPVTSAWWFIPSILFAIAIFGAIVGFIIKKLIEKRSNRKIKAQTNSYDRKHSLLFSKKEGADEAVASPVPSENDTVYDNFDEDSQDSARDVRTAEAEEISEEAEGEENKFHDEFDD